MVFGGNSQSFSFEKSNDNDSINRVHLIIFEFRSPNFDDFLKTFRDFQALKFNEETL